MAEIKQHEIKTWPKLRCQNKHKAFSDSHCLITISVGQESHESMKLAATLQEIDSKFKNITICVGDTLQRFTLAMKNPMSPDALNEQARINGDHWLERNKKYFKTLSKAPEVIRWDTYFENQNFVEFKSQLLSKYQTDSICKLAFDTAIDKYLKRVSSTQKPYMKLREYCFNYLLEESAVMKIWAENGYDYEAYPQRRNTAMEYTYNKLLYEKYHPKISSIYIKSVNFMY